MKIFLKIDNSKEQLFELLLIIWTSEQAVSELEKHRMSLFFVRSEVHELSVNNENAET